MVGAGLFLAGTGAAQRPTPTRIGALTESRGPTPQIVGLRGGLVSLGYRENAILQGIREFLAKP